MQIASAQRAAAGETECGDSFVVLDGETTTIAVVDGLGHGPEAAKAAEEFCAFVKEHASIGLEQLLREASQAISKTRGAAASLLRIHSQSRRVEFIGVGGVELRALSKEPIQPITTPGVVGHRMPKLLSFDYPVTSRDLLVLFTDGISGRFNLKSYDQHSPKGMAEAILANHGRSYDDATCVVVKL